ncbi:MAG: ABC transporter ATP-binding protein [Candidatus Palauibacterales bacterium]|nr:ABC transporter ATP-binding protein [Candidatus Palauibacterales bacterium]
MLLSVRDLRTRFELDEGELWPVNGVSFSVGTGETLGLVGESGSGKSMVALSILDLVPAPGRIVSGEVDLGGEDLLSMSGAAKRRVRGGEIGIVFQDPSASLNPVYRIGDQIADVARLHRGLGRVEARREAVHLLGDLGIQQPEKRARAYPFELSGGMRQRAQIAIAIAGRPRLLIADEPTTALDATVQAEICDLLKHVQGEFGMSILLISHDLALVADVADRIMVMYAGRIVEVGHWTAITQEPRHPYTKGLIGAIPHLGAGSGSPLEAIAGTVPDLTDLPDGCPFHPRCPEAGEDCRSAVPRLQDVGDRLCACYRVKHTEAVT